MPGLLERSYRFSAPLNFPATLRYIGRFENDRMNAVIDGTYYHVLADARGTFLIAVSQSSPQRLRVQMLTGRPSRSRSELITRFVARTFGSCADLNRFYRLRTTDEVLHKVRRRYRGLRVVGIVSLWECLAWAIIGQQVSVQSAFAVRSRLSRRAGASVVYKGEVFEGFPAPGQFLTLSSHALREDGFSRQKAQYVQELAERIVGEDLDEERLLTRPKDVARKELLSLRGIGPWTCEYTMMRVFGDTDALPLEDIGLRNAVAAEYGLGKQATMEQVAEISDAWTPFRGHATFYLWQTLVK